MIMAQAQPKTAAADGGGNTGLFGLGWGGL